MEFSREYLRGDLYQAVSDLESETGEVDNEAPTSKGLLKNITLTTGEKTLFLLANYRSDEDGLLQVEQGVLDGIAKFSDLEKIKAAMATRSLFRPNGNLLMSVTKTVTISSATKQVEVFLKRSEAKITVNLKTANGLTFDPGSYKLGNVPTSTFITEHTKGTDPAAFMGTQTGQIKNYIGPQKSSSSKEMRLMSLLHSICPRTGNSKKVHSPTSPGYNADRKGYDPENRNN
mgnify:CR=1 FL=1